MRWQVNLDPKPGEVQVAAWGGTTPLAVENGLIHDWVAAMRVPGATVEQGLKLFQRYEEYPSIFPGVVESGVLSHEGSRWRVHLRLRRKNLLTVVLDADYRIEYRALKYGNWAIISLSGPISEVENGKPLPPDIGNGFLWRLNAYWLLAPRAGGLYIECRTISLSRDIPAGLGWLIKPMVSGVPRDSLRQTMEAARRALK
ncbi:MAG TPA: SRPBCC family protein [Bryobacteraceae bacterium]|nr:SRPBCC family protein [Bryobacteraceae bacterium]